MWKKKLLFLKKKKQKDFCPSGSAYGTARDEKTGEKFFGSFFQKRTILISFRFNFPALVEAPESSETCCGRDRYGVRSSSPPRSF